MTNKNQKPAAGGNGASLSDNDELLSVYQYNRKDPLYQVSLNCRLSQLMTQAESQMTRHPENYGVHYLVWLSCFGAKQRVMAVSK